MWSIMMMSVHRTANYDAILKLLLEQPSIEVNLTDDKGATALHVATVYRNITAVRSLLADQRVDVNCKNWDQSTPLILASEGEQDFDAIKLLLTEQGVDVNWADVPKTIGDMTALVLKELIHHPSIDLNVKDKNGLSIDDLMR